MTYPDSDHFDGKHFSNLDKKVKLKNGFKNVLKWYLKDKKQPWPKFVANFFIAKLPEAVADNQVAVTFVNHATLLVQFQSLTIITDPVFSKRVSPLHWLGPKRIREPGLRLEKLPKIDVVTVSHNHYDHMDLASLKKINELHQPLFVVPLGNAKYLKKIGVTKIVELDWWQSYQVLPSYIINLVPAQHWSGRGLHDRNKSLWGGFVYQAHDLKVYFAGDTGYNGHFKAIYQRFGEMDVSLLPIGAYEPRWFMKEQHVNPEEAVLAHLDLHSQLSIAMHFGCFALASEAIEHPIQHLKISLAAHDVAEDKFKLLEHGETILFNKVV